MTEEPIYSWWLSHVKKGSFFQWSISKMLSICNHLCSMPCVQLLSCFVGFSSAAGSRPDIHSRSSNFKCKLFCFLISSLFSCPSLPPSSFQLQTDCYSLGWEAISQLHIFTTRETGRQKVTADHHHGIRRSTVLCFYSSPVWCFWSHYSHFTTHLEGECRCGFKYHNSCNTDARALDGLHVV